MGKATPAAIMYLADAVDREPSAAVYITDPADDGKAILATFDGDQVDEDTGRRVRAELLRRLADQRQADADLLAAEATK
jgi:hypothetical protein